MTAPAPWGASEVLKEQVAGGFAAVAGNYDAGGREFFGQMGTHLVAQVSLPAGARVLDVGCGKGAATFPAARAAGPGGQVTGIDLAGPMLARARDRARRDGIANVCFETGDAEDPGRDPGYPAASFGVILASNLIQLLPRPRYAARRWLPLLAGGGVLGVAWTVGLDARWPPVMAAVDAHLPDGVPGFGAFMRRAPFASVPQMEDMLASCGYEAVSTVMHSAETTYAGPGQWWAACLSSAPWAVSWRHIPGHRRETARRDAVALLDRLRAPDGTISRVLTYACTSARKPGSAAGDPGPRA